MFTTDLPSLPCYLNGEYVSLPEAKISVLDRGFIFGDGVYEVVPVYANCLFRFEHHLARLQRSLNELRIDNPNSAQQWREIAARLVSSQPDEPTQLIYIQVTRGVALRDHAMPSNLRPTVFVMCNKMSTPSSQQLHDGVHCVTHEDFRWEKAHIKSTSLLGAVFARQISVDAGATETIMFRRGLLSEASSSNVWVVKNGQLLGVPTDNLVLEGIRYGLIEEICQARGIPFALRQISREEVLAADEVLLSSASKEVLAVTRLDQQPVGQGRPGPVFAELRAGYQAAKSRYCESQRQERLR
jgi:D-alanine transaminase